MGRTVSNVGDLRADSRLHIRSVVQGLELAADAATTFAVSCQVETDGAAPPDDASARPLDAPQASGPGERVDFVPPDWLYPYQWHFELMGDIETIWDDYTGSGVHVGVYDSGVQYTHPDLASNYDGSMHVVVGGVVQDGGPGNSHIGHGTHVAGIIAADAGGYNGVGVAHGSKLTSVNIFDETSPVYVNAATPTGFMEALDQLGAFDVMNNSWGTPWLFYDSNNQHVAGSFGAKVNSAWYEGTTNGRDGLGTVIVKSAGNSNADAAGEGRSQASDVILVAAARYDGFAAGYSCFGSNLLVTAPGGSGVYTPDDSLHDPIWSTDLIGDGDGDYSDLDYAGISGTSMAAPMVSGVVALMLEANPDLGWRDVQNILAYSAQHTGSAAGAVAGLNENNTWFYNGASNWNGGGLHFSEDYGYGMVDAFAAVRMAEVWTLAHDAQTSANRAWTSMGQTQFESLIFGTTFDQTFTLRRAPGQAPFEIEHVTVSIEMDANQFWQTNIWLTSPAGTQVQLHNRSGIDGWATYGTGTHTWTFGAQAFRGEDLDGYWNLRIQDNESRDLGAATANYRILEYGYNFYGKAGDTANEYIYTSEYSELAAGARQTLNDTDGGVDTLIAVGVATASFIDLSGVLTSQVDDSDLHITGNTIENAYSGDGDDTLIGDDSANVLFGARGNDSLHGGLSADTLNGGEGDDFYALDSDDTVEDSGGSDSAETASATYTLDDDLEHLTGISTSGQHLVGNASFNVITAADWNDTLDGGAEGDTLHGGLGDDVYVVDGLDTIVELSGTDEVRTALVSYALAANLENLTGLAATGQSLTGNQLANLIVGSTGADTLIGGGGADTLQGGGGIDIASFAAMNRAVHVNLASGVVTGGQGEDWLAAIEAVVGSTRADWIGGDSAANMLDGAGGADTLLGGMGRDTLVGGAGLDAASYDTAVKGVTVNLSLAGVQATGGAGSDRLTGIENLLGSHFSDRLTGAGGANQLEGGEGADTLVGAGGKDVLTGGSGADVFLFTAISDSTGKAADLIVDLTAEDQIDLKALDANLGQRGNQAFVLVDQFDKHAGQAMLAYNADTGFTVLSLDLDGNGKADMTIRIAGDHSDFSHFVL